jgi:5-deoxy-glucuronate isomerase
MSDLLLEAGSWEQVTPESAGWQHLSFGVRSGSFSAETGGDEIAIVPLSGGGCHVSAEGETWELAGRANVFAGMPWALYLPRDTPYRVEAEGEVAICGARCEARREPVLIRPEDVEVEVRGAGNATRQINHLVKPEFPAERLLVVEVFTPSGNWSSYPPHKHDEDNPPGEVVLEETYYYRTDGFAVQRLYSPRHGLDLTATVRDGDLVLVPYGYHTTAAAHGYDLYYLNALAGDRRSMASADDPDLAWIRAGWAGQATDPRVPLVR